MSIENLSAAPTENDPKTQDQAKERKEKQLNLRTYLKDNKEVDLSVDDPAVNESLRQELKSNAGTCLFDGKILRYIDKEGNLAKVNVEAFTEGSSQRISQVDATLETLGFKRTSVSRFYSKELMDALESRRKNSHKEEEKKKEGFDF